MGKMTQWLRAMAILPETWIWVPEPHGIQQLSVTLVLEGSDTSVGTGEQDMQVALRPTWK